MLSARFSIPRIIISAYSALRKTGTALSFLKNFGVIFRPNFFEKHPIRLKMTIIEKRANPF